MKISYLGEQWLWFEWDLVTGLLGVWMKDGIKEKAREKVVEPGWPTRAESVVFGRWWWSVDKRVVEWAIRRRRDSDAEFYNGDENENRYVQIISLMQIVVLVLILQYGVIIWAKKKNISGNKLHEKWTKKQKRNWKKNWNQRRVKKIKMAIKVREE